jgi:DNA-binding transcriptional LysR family regulator
LPFKPGHLEYFVAVAEERQITRAARKLCIAQPALSQAIAQLEAHVGVRLVERHARGVTLTPAGESFLERARLAVAAERDAFETARSLARRQAGTIEFGFLGTPPGLDSPAPLSAFAQHHPAIDVRYRELTFPSASTSSWLAEVDVAVCHLPPVDPHVWVHPLRSEPRVVLAPKDHPLAGSTQLSVDDVLEERFIGLHPSIEHDWAGFWSLDDHRGGPPASVTPDRAINPQEVLASLSTRRAITTVPVSVAGVIVSVLPTVVAIPLHGADPCSIVLVGHEARSNQLVSALVAFARAWGPLDPPGWSPEPLAAGSPGAIAD